MNRGRIISALSHRNLCYTIRLALIMKESYRMLLTHVAVIPGVIASVIAIMVIIVLFGIIIIIAMFLKKR